MAPSKRNAPHDGYKRKNAGEPWFIVIETMAREILTCEPLAPDADLKAAMTAKRAQMSADGWSVEQPMRYQAAFFASRDGKRVFVNVGASHPDTRLESMYRR